MRSDTVDSEIGKSKLVSLILAILMAVLPVVNAQTLSIQQASGKDGIRGFNRENDVLQFIALAQLPGDTVISPSQVRIKSGNIEFLFNNCTRQSGDFYLCSFKQQVFGSRGQTTYNIQLLSDTGNVEQTDSETMTSDILAPEISIEFEPAVTNTGTSTLNYLVQDYAMQAGNTDVCSGNDRVQIWEGGVGQKLVATKILQQDCSESGQVGVTTTATGTVKYCWSRLTA